MQLGAIVDIDILVALVPLTLTRPDDPTQTLQGTFEVQARLPSIAQPYSRRVDGIEIVPWKTCREELRGGACRP